MGATRLTRRLNAPRAAVYRALLDARAIAQWMTPTGMTSQVHAFDAREGGAFRITLTYATPAGTGKTTAHSDITARVAGGRGPGCAWTSGMVTMP